MKSAQSYSQCIFTCGSILFTSVIISLHLLDVPHEQLNAQGAFLHISIDF